MVIGLVIGLSTYGVITAYNNSKGKATIISESSIKMCIRDSIKSATKMYVNQNKYELGFDCSGTAKEITLQTLVDTGLSLIHI